MTRVSGVGTLITSRPSHAASGAAAQPGFSVAADRQAGPALETQAAQNVALYGMLALQEAEAGAVQDKTARRHGLALLAALSDLQKSLLCGLNSPETEIRALTDLTSAIPQAADPGLAAVLDAVRLRAKIELLRRGVDIA